jgi:hypothetical protein
MNQENFDYLKDKLFYLGFGDKLNADLEKNITRGQEKFKLHMVGEFSKGEKKESVEYAVDFTKSKQNDMYFLNSYRATLAATENEKSQTFYINKGKGVTAKEAYNLLDGRAVHKDLVNKEGNPYSAWLQLTGKPDENGNHKIQQFHTAWGYDLDKSLAKHPIKELTDPAQKESLIKSLEKGNLQSVAFHREGRDEKMFIEANPKEKIINVYNDKMQKQFQGINERKTQSVKKDDVQQAPDEKKKVDKQDKAEEPDLQDKKTKGKKVST